MTYPIEDCAWLVFSLSACFVYLPENQSLLEYKLRSPMPPTEQDSLLCSLALTVLIDHPHVKKQEIFKIATRLIP